jgi:hypothetical protein
MKFTLKNLAAVRTGEQDRLVTYQANEISSTMSWFSSL